MYFNWRLWEFTEGFRARISIAVLIGLLGTLIGIIRLALLGWLLAAVFSNQTINDLLLPVLIFIGTILLRGIIEHWRTMIAHETAALIQRNLRQRIYQKVVELGPAHFGQHRTGDAIVSLVDSVEQLETYFGQYLPQLFIAFFTPVLITGFTFYLDEYVAVVMLFSALFTLIAPMAFHNWDEKNSLARSKAYKLFASDFLDSLQGLSTLKSFGQSKTRLKLLGKRAHQLFQSTMWVLATNAAARGITDAGIAIGAAIALGVGAWRVSTGEANLQILLIVLMMGTEVFRPLRDLRALLHNGMIGQSAAFAIFNILDAQPIVRDINPTDFSRLPATLAFENVSFSYPESKTLIHNKINFEVKAGERIGIVGKSGSGKSTILKLLLRFYKPNSGVIKLGGNDITKLDFDQVRRQMAVVSQDTYLFHGSILENIGFGSTNPNKEDIRQAAIAANIDEFIKSLPHGYNTIVGERGIRLSGGQRQRIAIARAILRDAPILILDEALSSVDAENEWIIQEALDRLMKGRTSLVIAHRLSSVIQCDRILVIKDGQIANSGSHKKLSEHSQLYQELMSEQIHGRLKTGQKNYLPQALLKSRTKIIQDPSLISNPTEIQDDDLSKVENLSWWQVFKILLEKVKPWNKKLLLTLVLGVSRVIAFIGVGVAGALAVIAVKMNDPYLPYLYWLAVLAPIAGIFHWLESWIAHDMAFRMLTEMRIELFRKLDKLAPAFLAGKRSGDLVSMATTDVEMVEYFFAHTLAPAFVAVLVPSAVLLILGSIDYRMVFALLPFILCVSISPFLLRKRVDELATKTRQALGELNAHAVDSIQGLTEIVSFQNEKFRGREFDLKVDSYLKARLPFFRNLSLQESFLEVVTGMGGVAIIATGAMLVGNKVMEPDLLPMLTIISMAAFLPVSEIANVGRQLADTFGSTRRLNAIEKEPVLVTDGPKVNADSKTLHLSIEKVDFSYPGRAEKVLTGLSLDIPTGTTLAIVGQSGAGKTTLANLLLRFWDPEAGAIKLNGHNIRNLKLENLREHFALVSQDTFLFNTTLKENILLAKPNASNHEVQEALEAAALSKFISQLPNGLDTQVGERGVKLSGGQRQRIAIARALIKGAPVLILDEATSHLDAVSEQIVRSTLKSVTNNCTTIIIAHRLSTVQNADKIAVLYRGTLAETGTHSELLSKNGLYKHLVHRQMAETL